MTTCKHDGHIWNLAAEKCAVCGLAVSDVTLTPEQREEFTRLNDTVKNDNYEIVITLKIKTYGTKEQAERTLVRFKSEVALQHFDVTYGTEFIRDSTTFAERFTTDYVSVNEVRSIIDRTFGDKVEPDVEFPEFLPNYDLITETVDDFEISKRKYMASDKVMTGNYFVRDIQTGLTLSYLTHDLMLLDRLEARRQLGNTFCWLQIVDRVSELVVDSIFKVV